MKIRTDELNLCCDGNVRGVQVTDQDEVVRRWNAMNPIIRTVDSDA